MTADRWSEVDHYFTRTLALHDDVLDTVQRSAAEAGLPDIAVTANQGKLLHLLAKLVGARRILEVGTLGGYSTIWLARALPADGRLVTIEADPTAVDVARRNIERAGLAEKVEIREGKALDVLPTLEPDHPPVDLAFIDADKVNNPRYVRWALELSRPGSVIVVDNVVRDGRVIEEGSDDASVRGTREAIELLREEPRLDATALQTVGVKGYDGLAIALVVS
ncbi:O-methyltransferase [Saccharomonospora sp. NB11]|uniref:O-methyltransferase n=1 Tax=Saccharomonospora sp. NB11 TaxID=1642298 RepID=UPI0018D1131E|nr:O-methyltransferase [Saccharomonospora sp. NB11]